MDDNVFSPLDENTIARDSRNRKLKALVVSVVVVLMVAGGAMMIGGLGLVVSSYTVSGNPDVVSMCYMGSCVTLAAAIAFLGLLVVVVGIVVLYVYGNLCCGVAE